MDLNDLFDEKGCIVYQRKPYSRCILVTVFYSDELPYIVKYLQIIIFTCQVINLKNPHNIS